MEFFETTSHRLVFPLSPEMLDAIYASAKTGKAIRIKDD